MADTQDYKPKEGDKVVKLSDTVNFKVGYGKDFKGKKHLKEGDTIILHIDQAKGLEAKGVGSIVKK